VADELQPEDARRPVPREVIDVLLEFGADVAATNHHGQTALHRAALHGNRIVVEHLFARGLDPGHRDDGGKTPAELAVEAGHAEISALLRRD
jgi:ankyrin repeat protein